MLWKTEDSIGHLVLNDPPSNGMGRFFFSELALLTREIIPRSNVAGIIIYGSGRHFSSGAVLQELIGEVKTASRKAPQHAGAGCAPLMDNLRSFVFFEELNIPVVAAIRGVCLGSALELALFCHARICGTGSVLGLPETTFGLLPGCGGVQKLNALAGRPRALELLLSGASFSAEEALEWNIVDAIVPKKDIVREAIKLIKRVSGDYNRYSIRSSIKKYI